jgi:DNA-binding ferritin-like protein (Dps family)
MGVTMKTIDDIGSEAKGHVEKMISTEDKKEYQEYRGKLRACAYEYYSLLESVEEKEKDNLTKIWEDYLDQVFSGAA